MLLQIVDWDRYFENDRSRTRIQCSFVCVPNKQHGMGFRRLMLEPDGAMIYGIFHLLLGACSQQRKPRQGFLTDDGSRRGRAWTEEDLAVKFGRPLEEITRSISMLITEKIGWLRDATITADSPPTHRVTPALAGEPKELSQVAGESGTSNEKSASPHELTADSPSTHLGEKGREEERNGMERREGSPPLPSEHDFPEAEWPTLEQVLAFCLRATPDPIPQEIGKKFWEHYEKVRLPKWTTSSGQHFQWQGKLRAWALDESRNGGGTGGGEKNRPDWAKQKDALARIGQLNELIETSPANRETVYHKASATEADRAQLKKWRGELAQLKRGQA